MSEGDTRVEGLRVQKQFLEIWQKLLDAVMDKMVPSNDLLKICNDLLIHKCLSVPIISRLLFTPGFLSTDLLGKDCPDSFFVFWSS